VTRVYFDGACYLCSREIEHYRSKDRERLLQFVDISDPAFSAANEGLDPLRVQQTMHVRDASGRLHQGVDAFLQIWRCIPGYRFIPGVARSPGVYQALRAGYFLFAKVRPYLPKKKRSACKNGICTR
jgi:predicted DCC family thiol-disulfide oxidoreductase YuxK